MVSQKRRDALTVVTALLASIIATSLYEKGAHNRRPLISISAGQESARRPPPVMQIGVHPEEANEPRKGSTGTAFAIDSKGNWLTARHVVEDCKHVFLVMPPLKSSRPQYWLSTPEGTKTPIAVADVIIIDHTSDLALIRTREVRHEALTLAKADDYSDDSHQVGFGIGFPGGKPGEAATQLMGHTIAVMHMNKDTLRQPSLVWSIRQLNSATNKLPGLSGGPLVNENSEIAGVNSAGNDRRGRLITVAPAVVKQWLNSQTPGTSTAVYRPEAPLNEVNFANVAKRLRSRYTVAQVACFYNE